MSTATNPYIGPRTFKEDERDRFFGRDREANELVARVLSEQEIVFYAQSGAGKSSLVNTCLVPELKERGYRVLQGRVSGDARPELEVSNIFVFNLLRSLSGVEVQETALAGKSLGAFLAPIESTSPEAEPGELQPRVLIIDQFEEIFSTHHEAWELRSTFFEELAGALTADPQLRLLLVMREDYIAHLDPYAPLLRSRFRIRYYMQRLEFAAALKAVKEPVKAEGFGRPYERDAAEKLVNDLRTIKVTRPDGSSDVGLGQFVEPLYLQVICYELWNNLPPDGTTITMKNVQDVGDVSTSLGNYYARRVAAVAEAEKVSESRIRRWFTEELISPTGIRNMVLEDSGERSAGLENRVIRALSDLIRAEQRGGSVFFELTHDRLVQPIIVGNRLWFEQHLSALQKQAALWHSEKRKESWLVTDETLPALEQWSREHPDEVGDTEREFLRACWQRQREILAEQSAQQREQERQRRELEMAKELADQQAQANLKIRKALRTSRIVAGVASVLLIVAIFLGVQTYQNQRSTEMQVMLNASAVELGRGNTELATRLAYQALANFGDHGEAEEGLANIADPMEPRVSSQVPFLIPNNNTGVGAIAYNPADGGQTLAAGYADGGLYLIDIGTQKTVGAPFEGHTAAILGLAFSPDGSELVSSSADGTILIWNVESHEQLGVLATDLASVASIALNPAGDLLAAGYDDSTVVLWDLNSFERIGAPLVGHSARVSSLAFSPDGRVLASGGYDQTIRLWDVSEPEQGRPIGEPLTGHTDWVNTLAFSPDGTLLASGGDTLDKSIRLWDVSDLTNPHQLGDPLTGHTYTVASLAFSPDGRTLASVGNDYLLILWDVASRQQLGDSIVQPDYSAVTSVAFSPDGTQLAVGSRDRSRINFWEVANRAPASASIEAIVPEGKTAVTGLAFGQEGDILAIAGDQFWLWENDRLLSETELPESLDADPDYHQESIANSRLYALSPDGLLRLDADTSTAEVHEIATYQVVSRKRHGGSNNQITALAFSADGQWVASGDTSSVVRIWAAGNGRQIALARLDRNPEQSAGVAALAFSPDASRLAIAYNDPESTVEVWDIASAKKVFVVSNRQQQSLSYTVVNALDRKPANTFGNSDEASENAVNRADQVGNRVADLRFAPDGLYVLYENGVIDRWDIWISRAELRRYAETVCGACTLSTVQRIEYGLYSWPMRIHDNAGAIILFFFALYYAWCIWQIRRNVFRFAGGQPTVPGFTWRKLMMASLQGAALVLIGSLTWLLVSYAEDIVYFQQETRPSTTDGLVWLAVPLALWTGGVYSHLTRQISGPWSRRKRTLLSFGAGALSGLLVGSLGLILVLLIMSRSLADAANDPGTVLVIIAIASLLGGGLGLLGSLLHWFWLKPWSEGSQTGLAIGLHILFGLGLFFTAKHTRRKWIYPLAALTLIAFWLLVALDLDYSIWGWDFIPDDSLGGMAAVALLVYLFSWIDLWRSIRKGPPSGPASPAPSRLDRWLQVWWKRGLIVLVTGGLLGAILLTLDQSFSLDTDTAFIILGISLVLGIFGFLFYPHRSSYIMTAVFGGLGALVVLPDVGSFLPSVWVGLSLGFMLSAIISRILHALKKI